MLSQSLALDLFGHRQTELLLALVNFGSKATLGGLQFAHKDTRVQSLLSSDE